jgi:hypothetical protein
MPATKCDIIRDTGKAFTCGMCAAITAGNSAPSGCSSPTMPPPPEVACSVPNAANARLNLFEKRYSPANLFESATNKAIRQNTEKTLQTIIQKNESELAAAYPGAAPGATKIAWPDFERCLWNKSGDGGGNGNNIYFKRIDLEQTMGMAPKYPIGKAHAQGSIWKSPKTNPSPLPVSVDYLMNPDLFVIVMFAFLVIVFAALMWAASKSLKKAPYLAQQKKDAERQRLEANDPYRGSDFESYPDPQAKCRAYVESMEQQGYSMDYYRTKCGLPPAPS